MGSGRAPEAEGIQVCEEHEASVCVADSCLVLQIGRNALLIQV